jgi:hypothetical protein
MSFVPVGHKFDSAEAAQAADDEFYRSLTPEQRMEIFFELLSRLRDYEAEAATGFPRVSRVAELPRR